MYTVQAIKQRLGTKEIKDNLEAKKMEGQWELMGILETKRGEVVTRNNNDILMPWSFLEEILNKLHAGPRGTEAMVLQARGKFWLPNIKSEIRSKFHRCETCLLNSPLKPDPPFNGIPDDLTMLASNECISLDFMDVLKKSVLVVKDHHSGFIWARLTPNKECKTVIRFLTRYLHTFDRPSMVLSDGGPCFWPEFTKFLEAYHIQQQRGC